MGSRPPWVPPAQSRRHQSRGGHSLSALFTHPPFSQQRACLPCMSPSFQPTLPPTHFLLFLFLVESVSFSWYHCLRSKWIAIDSPSQQAFAELLSQVGVASSEITVSASKPSRTALRWVCTLLLWEHRGGTSVQGLQQASQESCHLTWLFKEKRAGARRRSGKGILVKAQ